MPRWWILATGLAAVLVLSIAGGAGWWFFLRSPGDFTVDGQLVVAANATTFVNGMTRDCTAGQYPDIVPGAEVSISSDQKLLALASLGSGQYRLTNPNSAGLVYTNGCAFGFTAKVPGGHDFYSIEVAHRGAVNFTADQVKTPGAVVVSLGK